MRYSASEKFEIIELVEQSSLSGHWLQLGSRDRRSTTGTADTRRAGSKLWRMASRDRGGSGTRSLTRSKRRSSIWPLRSRTCRRVSSPSTGQLLPARTARTEHRSQEETPEIAAQFRHAVTWRPGHTRKKSLARRCRVGDVVTRSFAKLRGDERRRSGQDGPCCEPQSAGRQSHGR